MPDTSVWLERWPWSGARLKQPVSPEYRQCLDSDQRRFGWQREECGESICKGKKVGGIGKPDLVSPGRQPASVVSSC